MSELRNFHRGFSFIELIGALAASTVLVIGLASTLGVALKASSTDSTPAASKLAALNMLAEMGGELTYATALTEKTAVAITAAIPDRDDADTSAETVRYSWSGTAGHPLMRRYNTGSVAVVVPAVYDFSVRYVPTTGPVELLSVRLRTSADSRTAVETSIPLLNRP